MGTNLKDYLTGEEKRQMDALLAKAEERMNKNGEEGCRGQFIIIACQCGCEQISREEERDNLPNDMENLLAQVCNFCKEHNMCPEYCTEELPF